MTILSTSRGVDMGIHGAETHVRYVRHVRPVISAIVVSIAAGVTLAGCKDLSATLPSGTPNPSVFNTPAGALQKRNAADSIFESAVLQYIVDVGLLTDELTDPSSGAARHNNDVSLTGILDERNVPELANAASNKDGAGSYNYLQAVRGSTSEAFGALEKYDTVSSPAVRGEMYAIQAYAEVMLGELFCSGVPLSTYDFEGDFTYEPGSTQQQVYQEAITKFDSALVLSRDSARIQNFIRVGLGRTYLDLGDYAHAAAAVASVPDEFQYQVNIQWNGGSPNGLNRVATISNSEGINGLPFVTSSDPRTPDTTVVEGGSSSFPFQLDFPRKYIAGLQAPYYSPVTIADGVEARLIQAEAALNTGSANWRTILNTLRSNGAAGLDTLADPGASLSGAAATAARVDLLFQERAYWLYLTGHRQGDLRRLVRQYHRDQSTVYPTGPYLALGLGVYGSDVNAPIPSTETPNPNFHGCLDRKA